MSTNLQSINSLIKREKYYSQFSTGPNMNKYNRRKFSELSTTKENRSKTLPESEQKSQQSPIGNFLSSMVFNFKPREKRSLQLNGNENEYNKKRFSVVTDRNLGMNINQQAQSDLQEGLIDISLPKPLNLRVIKQSTGLMHKKKLKMAQKMLFQINTQKREQRWSKMNKSRPIQRNTSNISSKAENEKIMSPSQRDHHMKMGQLSSYLDEDKLYRRLCVYSKENIKISIRLYREDLQKLIVHRYGKDRITTFLDTQYIEDYNSILKTLKNLLKFTAEEILVFVFLIMDQNCDGLITPEDLVNFIGAKNDKIFTNPLIMQDLHNMMSYLKKKHLENEDLVDLPSHQYEVLSDQFLTLMKFRVFKFQTRKKSNDKEGRNRRKKLMVGNVHQRLFTLRQDKKDTRTLQNRSINKGLSCMISFILKGNKKREKKSEQITPLQFAINIESFKQIFENKIPKTFLDFLYLFGGVESPKLSYLPIDSSVLIKQTESKIEVLEQRGIEKVKHLIEGMKEFSRESTVIYNTIISD